MAKREESQSSTNLSKSTQCVDGSSIALQDLGAELQKCVEWVIVNPLKCIIASGIKNIDSLGCFCVPFRPCYKHCILHACCLDGIPTNDSKADVLPLDQQAWPVTKAIFTPVITHISTDVTTASMMKNNYLGLGFRE